MGGSGRNTPLSSAKAELLASLENLGETHQFQIIFYNEKPTMFALAGHPDRLVFGTSANRATAQHFVRGIVADGGTRHEDALWMALKLQPDVIFFLTDADQPQLSAAQLDKIQRTTAAARRSIRSNLAWARASTTTTSWCVWRVRITASTRTSMCPKTRSIRNSVQCVCGAALLVAACLVVRAAAEDAIYLVSPKNPHARTKLVGRIVEYTGRELVLETGTGEKRYAADQVIDVDSQWSPAQQAADERFAARDYAAALSKYEEALRGEKRRWVERK